MLSQIETHVNHFLSKNEINIYCYHRIDDTAAKKRIVGKKRSLMDCGKPHAEL